jgi:hypothetical protein
MTMNEFKPCPFCGSVYRLHICNSDYSQYVSCLDCMPGEDVESSVWNTRVIEDSLNEEIKRLQDGDPLCENCGTRFRVNKTDELARKINRDWQEDRNRLFECLKQNDLLIEKTRWIPIEERLPEKGSVVLTYDAKNDICISDPVTYSRDFRGIFQGIFGIDDGVTHWMPLPNPPEEE